MSPGVEKNLTISQCRQSNYPKHKAGSSAPSKGQNVHHGEVVLPGLRCGFSMIRASRHLKKELKSTRTRALDARDRIY